MSNYNDSYIPDSSGNGVRLWLPGGSANPLFLEYNDGDAVGYYVPHAGSKAHAIAPSAAVKALTGDIELIFAGKCANWAGANDLIGRYAAAEASRCFYLDTSSGNISLKWYETGDVARTASVALDGSFTAWATVAVKATLDVDNGAGGYTVTFYKSTDYNAITGTGNWSQLGDPVTAAGGLGGGATDIRSVTDDAVLLSTHFVGNGQMIMYRAQVYDGVTLIADFDPNETPNRNGSFTDSLDNFWYPYGLSYGRLPWRIDRDSLIFDGSDDYLRAINRTYAGKYWVIACQQKYDSTIKIVSAAPGAANGSDFRIGYDSTRTDFAEMRLIMAAVFNTQPTAADLIAISNEVLGEDVAMPYFEPYASNPLVESGVNLSLTTCMFWSVIKASNYIETPIDTYYAYTGTDHAGAEETGGIYLFTAPSPLGPWTEYEPGGNPGEIFYDPAGGVGHHTETPAVWWDSANSRLLMMYHMSNVPSPQSISWLASSTDGISWTPIGVAVTGSDLDPEYSRIDYFNAPILDNGVLYSSGHTAFPNANAWNQQGVIKSTDGGSSWEILVWTTDYSLISTQGILHSMDGYIRWGGKNITITADRDVGEALTSFPACFQRSADHRTIISNSFQALSMVQAWEASQKAEVWGVYVEGTTAYVYFCIDRAAVGVAVGVCDAA